MFDYCRIGRFIILCFSNRIVYVLITIYRDLKRDIQSLHLFQNTFRQQIRIRGKMYIQSNIFFLANTHGIVYNVYDNFIKT